MPLSRAEWVTVAVMERAALRFEEGMCQWSWWIETTFLLGRLVAKQQQGEVLKIYPLVAVVLDLPRLERQAEGSRVLSIIASRRECWYERVR